MKVGLIKGGQLGLMYMQACDAINDEYFVLDNDPEAPCRKYAQGFTEASASDYESVLNFGKDLDALVIEFEHVNVKALYELEEMGVKVYPSARILETVQDKGVQKQFYKDHGFPTASFELVEGKEMIESSKLGLPCVQKTRKAGYDGKGVQILKSEEDLHRSFDQPSVLEEMVDFQSEISVMVGRSADGEMKCWPAVDMIFHPEHNLVEFLSCPSEQPKESLEEAKHIAYSLAEELQLVGILAVEMFVLKDGSILVNEMAPRAHNSGHHTIEANVTSQFEQLGNIVHGQELESTDLETPAVMINLIGEPGHTGKPVYQGLEEVEAMEMVYVHLYEKAMTKPARKMGHVTILDDDLEKAKEKARMVQKILTVVT